MECELSFVTVFVCLTNRKYSAPIIDRLGRIFAVLAGTPTTEGYEGDLLATYDGMNHEVKAAGLGVYAANPLKRGRFHAYNCGVTLGMGSPYPILPQPGDMAPVLARLLRHQGVKRMARFQDRCDSSCRLGQVTIHLGSLNLWAPRLYKEYANVRARTESKLNIPWNFEGSVFAAAAFNFGGKVRTFLHRDFLNWAFGWCAITALGKFNPKCSARLILWELKLVIDFPPASTILLPSAVITHSNTPIAEGDYRNSFTQYTAGPIFRWVRNGCRTEKQSNKEDTRGCEEMMAGKQVVYELHFSKIDELVDLIE